MIKQPKMSPVPGTELCVVDEVYSIVLPVSGKTLTIQAGFTTDGASIPRCLWSLVGAPFDPNYMAPALCHDALYEAELLTRDECDQEFKCLLDLNGPIAMDKAETFYKAVHYFGWITTWAWHTKASIAEGAAYASLT